MMGPGVSLNSMAKLFELDYGKQHFPFRCLTGLESLKRDELPTDPAMWRSDLTGGCSDVCADIIEDAVADYHRVGAKNVGEFLRQ